MRAVGGGGEGGDGLVVEEDGACGGVVEAFEQGDGCGFAAALESQFISTETERGKGGLAEGTEDDVQMPQPTQRTVQPRL